MPDPLTIFGSVASVISIIDVLAKTVVTLHNIRSQWRETNLTLLHLTSQLTVLTAALDKIKEWMESDNEEAHHLLVMGLESSLTCCDILATKLDGELAEIKRDSSGAAELPAKFRFLLNSNSMEQISKMIERQTSSLHLLLTACNTRMLSEQHRLLNKPKARKTIRQVQKDTTSLKAHRDSTSLLSSYTDNFSKQSMVFEFDGELFASKVYAPMVRNVLKKGLRFRPPRVFASREAEDAIRNREINKLISNDRRRQEREVKILMLGAGEAAKSTFLKQTRVICASGFSTEERKQWRAIIFNNLMSAFQTIIAIMQEEEMDLEHDNNINLAELIAEDHDISIEDCMPTGYLTAFERLWADKSVQLAILKGGEYALHDNLSYLISDLNRLFQPDYLPTDQDILHTRLRTTGITETIFDINENIYRMFDVGGARSDRKKWIHVFDNVQVVLFFASLSGYDMCLIEDKHGNQMREALMLWESISNSRYFIASAKVLIFTKRDLFSEKISSGRSPIASSFPEYHGNPTDVDTAQDFFARKFMDVYRGEDRIHIRFIDATDANDVRTVMDVVRGLHQS